MYVGDGFLFFQRKNQLEGLLHTNNHQQEIDTMGNKRSGNNQSRNNKRRRNGDDDEESNSHQLDPVFGQYRALPISQEKLANVKPDTIPEDAETYLAMVR